MKKLVSDISWLFHGIMRTDRYEQYLASHQRKHASSCTPLTEAEFWENIYHDMETSPQSRCC